MRMGYSWWIWYICRSGYKEAAGSRSEERLPAALSFLLQLLRAYKLTLRARNCAPPVSVSYLSDPYFNRKSSDKQIPCSTDCRKWKESNMRCLRCIRPSSLRPVCVRPRSGGRGRRATSSSCVLCCTISPWSTTKIRSALRTVLSRCAIMMTVLLCVSSRTASISSFSFSGSTLAVASFRLAQPAQTRIKPGLFKNLKTIKHLYICVYRSHSKLVEGDFYRLKA